MANTGEGRVRELDVRTRREPVLLDDKLAALGFAARAGRRPDGELLIRIAPA